MNTYVEGVNRQEEAAAFREGPVAKTIEKRTAKLPSDIFLWAAGASVLLSLAFEVRGIMRGELGGRIRRFRAPRASEPLAGFVGMWVPSLLLLGVYNKIVKVAGSDRTERI